MRLLASVAKKHQVPFCPKWRSSPRALLGGILSSFCLCAGLTDISPWGEGMWTPPTIQQLLEKSPHYKGVEKLTDFSIHSLFLTIQANFVTNLTLWQEGTSVKELPKLGFPMDTSLVAFSCLLIDVAGLSPLWVVLSLGRQTWAACVRKAADCEPGSESVSSVPLWFKLQAPASRSWLGIPPWW